MFYRPLALEAIEDCCGMDRIIRTPIRQAPCLAMQRNHSIASCISALGMSGCPVTVGGVVSPRIITALQRMLAARPWPHICIESGKRVLPGLTDGNPSTTIPRKRWIGRVQAPFTHGLPNPEFSRLRHPVFPRQLKLSLLIQASTASRRLLLQIGGAHTTDCATDALAHPLRSPVSYTHLTLPTNREV